MKRLNNKNKINEHVSMYICTTNARLDAVMDQVTFAKPLYLMEYTEVTFKVPGWIYVE